MPNDSVIPETGSSIDSVTVSVTGVGPWSEPTATPGPAAPGTSRGRTSCDHPLDEDRARALSTSRARLSASAYSTSSSRGSGNASTTSTPDDLGAVDLGDLAFQRGDQVRIGEDHRQLVERGAVVTVHHLDPDDVALDRADPRRDETERAGPVRDADPDQRAAGAHGRHPTDRWTAVPGVAHAPRPEPSWSRP